MATQGSFDWQGRLASDGEVVFGGRLSGRLIVTRDGVRRGARRPSHSTVSSRWALRANGSRSSTRHCPASG
jgi:hypothetical protein